MASSTGDEAVQAQLDHKLPDINFNAVTFADVVDFLRDVTGANIVVDWTVLEAAGIDKSVPITLRLHDIKFSTVLQKVLDQASPTKGTDRL